VATGGTGVGIGLAGAAMLAGAPGTTDGTAVAGTTAWSAATGLPHAATAIPSSRAANVRACR
jgi:hypothetical protein